MTTPLYPTFDGLAFNVKRAPMFQTRLQISVSGKETGLSDWAYPRYEYELVYEFLRQGTIHGVSKTELATAMGFFNQVLGRRTTFNFEDPDDKSVTTENFGTGDGATTQFQLRRAFGGFAEPIQSLNSAPLIYVNSILKTVTTDYTVGTTGIVTFVTAPGNGLLLTWTGTYYWPARFLDDKLTFEKFVNQIWEARSVKLISRKL